MQVKLTLPTATVAALDEARGELSRSKAADLALRAWLSKSKITTKTLLASVHEDRS